MICREIQERLCPFLAGELSGDEARQLRSHLAACPACLSMLSGVDRIEILPILDRRIEPAEDLQSRFHERLSANRAEGSTADRGPHGNLAHVWSWFAPGKIAAVGTLAAFLLLGVRIGLYHVPAPGQGPGSGEIPIAENLPLLQNLGVIRNLDLLEDFDAIEDISQGGPAPIPAK